jgi:uncharacterized membrane protein YbhN (UPF0104 family)
MVAAVVAQAASLGCYAQLYRQVLATLGARLRFRLAADVVLASFLVSHVVPFGSAAGPAVNASTLERDGIAATVGRHLPQAYLTVAGIALAVVVAVLATVLAVGAHQAVAGRAGRRAATVPRRFRRGIDPEKAASASRRLASLARSALTGRAFAVSFGFAAADLLFDLLSLDLMFLAFGYQPGFGPLAVAYAAANIASAVPLTPGGLGVVELTPVAITVGFGAPGPRRSWPCSATGW